MLQISSPAQVGSIKAENDPWLTSCGKFIILFLTCVIHFGGLVQRVSAESGDTNLIDVIAVVDASLSMQNTDPDKYVVEWLENFVENLNTGSRFGVVFFARGVIEQIDLTTINDDTVKTLKKEINDKYDPIGRGTDSPLALNYALDILIESKKSGVEQYIVWLTDGIDDDSLRSYEVQKRDRDLAITKAKENSITDYSVGLNYNGEMDIENLSLISRTSGGKTFEVKYSNETLETLDKITSEIIFGKEPDKIDKFQFSKELEQIPLAFPQNIDTAIVTVICKTNVQLQLKPKNSIDFMETSDKFSISKDVPFSTMRLLKPDSGDYLLYVSGEIGSDVIVTLKYTELPFVPEMETDVFETIVEKKDKSTANIVIIVIGLGAIIIGTYVLMVRRLKNITQFNFSDIGEAFSKFSEGRNLETAQRLSMSYCLWVELSFYDNKPYSYIITDPKMPHFFYLFEQLIEKCYNTKIGQMLFKQKLEKYLLILRKEAGQINVKSSLNRLYIFNNETYNTLLSEKPCYLKNLLFFLPGYGLTLEQAFFIECFSRYYWCNAKEVEEIVFSCRSPQSRKAEYESDVSKYIEDQPSGVREIFERDFEALLDLGRYLELTKKSARRRLQTILKRGEGKRNEIYGNSTKKANWGLTKKDGVDKIESILMKRLGFRTLSSEGE
ncbi:hypothetical protein AGMMS49944_21350 [Spirochaetia bacterium]|nr:hypothetical protein AGMMS49944_21350 [Spirochaetia bacterium]